MDEFTVRRVTRGADIVNLALSKTYMRPLSRTLWQGDCPICTDGTLYVCQARQLFTCAKCRESGDVIRLEMLAEDMSPDCALRSVAEHFDISLPAGRAEGMAHGNSR